LSTRTDLLPAKYAKGLTGLQDAVPPFSAELGLQVIESELNITIDDVFSELSLQPVASASIGQVYRGRLRATGEEVAVKVQRPAVLSKVALDLYMLRSLAPIYQKSKEINTDLVGLVDAWGEGFVNELDYRAEARYTTEFSKAMKERGLGSVFAPEVVDSLSSIHVLTTKWVDGQRLADSDAEDVPRLCGVALNAYLTMLLDTGTLHCDPHPGNLLRTPDGRLCILDWGMVINVPHDLQLSLLEFIADLNAKNYEDVPDDLVKLQFVPANKIEELRSSGLTVAIANLLSLAAEGGGPKGAMKRMVAQNKEKYAEALKVFDDLDSKEATEVRQRLFREDWRRQMAEDAISRDGSKASASSTSTTADVTMKIEQMQEQNADVFAIPDYFVYMSRAFSTLEGIGLSSDPNYSILQECYPYLAKRLLTDDSPRARGALKMLIYGKNGNELDLSKIEELSKGFESYTSSTSSVESGRGRSNEGRSAALEQLTNILLSEDGNFVQDLLLHESAVALDATIREAILSPLEPLRNTPFQLPSLGLLTLPLDVAKATLELQAINESDQKKLENVRIVTDALSRRRGRSTGASANANEPASPIDLVRVLQEGTKRQRALARIGLRFGGSLTHVQAKRLRERAGVKSKRKKNGDDIIRERLANQGAETLEALADAISTLDSSLANRK
jgi:predicted unusual protein kinase regulating ubiquinone biosynthesis (AarF/ABC1/UbiB family)